MQALLSIKPAGSGGNWPNRLNSKEGPLARSPDLSGSLEFTEVTEMISWPDFLTPVK